MSRRRTSNPRPAEPNRPSPALRLRAHLWQAGRGAPALFTHIPLVDDRSEAQVLADLLAFAGAVPLEGAGSGAVGSWADLLAGEAGQAGCGDLSFLLAEIVSVEAGREYDAQRDAIKDRRIGDITAATLAALQRLDGWYARIARSRLEAVPALQALVQADFESIIRGDRSKTSEDLSALVQKLRADHPHTVELQQLDPIWASPSADATAPGGASAIGSDAALVFSAFNSATRSLAASCRRYFEQSIRGSMQHAPHTGLLLAFLLLLTKTRARLNGLVDDHLAFYYQDVLRLRRRSATPDVAQVAFALAPQAQPFVLPKGSRLDAGLDATGRPILYATDADLFIGHAQVRRLKAVQTAWVRRDTSDGGDPEKNAPMEIGGVFAFEAECAGGADAAICIPAGWTPFGGAEHARCAAKLGLSLRSDLLQLSGGTRSIDATIVSADPAALAAAIDGYASDQGRTAERETLAGAFLVEVSTATGYKGVSYGATVDRAAGTLTIGVTLDPTFPSVCPPNPARADAKPALRILLDPAAPVYAYGRLAPLELKSIELRVAVKGLRSADAATLLGPVKGDKPFAPFGNPALRGSALTVSFPELAGKNPERLSIGAHWASLPGGPADFATYYAGYGRAIDRSLFRVTLEVLHSRQAPTTVIADASLFQTEPEGGVCPQTIWSMSTDGVWTGDDSVPAVRIKLIGPDFGFGFPLWPSLVAAAAGAAAHRGHPAADGGPASPMPNMPWVPMVDTLTLDYEAGTQLSVGQLDGAGRPGTGVFKIDPFGSEIEFVEASVLPPVPTRAYLFLGLAGCRPGSSLDLLFEVGARDASTASGRSAASGPRQRHLGIDILSDGSWLPLQATACSADTTARLTKPGILSIQLPNVQSSRNPSFDPDLIWLRIPSEHVPTSYGSLRGLHCHAVTASRVIDATAPPIGAISLPPGSIAKLSGRTARIVIASQPLASEGGSAAETRDQFRIRVSERLRHKDRAVLVADYEALVLEAFPDVGDARCFGRRGGRVVVVVAPRRHKGAMASCPRIAEYRLEEIAAFLQRRCAPSVRSIIVRNPAYEPVKATAWLQLDGDSGDVRQRLQRQIDAYLAPWIGCPEIAMSIGLPALDLCGLRSTLEREPSVRGVTGLSLTHLAQDRAARKRRSKTGKPAALPANQGPNGMDEHRYRLFDTAGIGSIGAHVAPLHAWSVLTPARHDLRVVGDLGIGAGQIGDDFIVARADTGTVAFARAPRHAGIGNLEVGSDLLVGSRA